MDPIHSAAQSRRSGILLALGSSGGGRDGKYGARGAAEAVKRLLLVAIATQAEFDVTLVALARGWQVWQRRSRAGVTLYELLGFAVDRALRIICNVNAAQTFGLWPVLDRKVGQRDQRRAQIEQR